MRKRDKTLLIVLSEAESDALRDIIGAGEIAGTREGANPLKWFEHAALQAIRTVQRLFFWKQKQA
jgi:hypothetical protein